MKLLGGFPNPSEEEPPIAYFSFFLIFFAFVFSFRFAFYCCQAQQKYSFICSSNYLPDVDTRLLIQSSL